MLTEINPEYKKIIDELIEIRNDKDFSKLDNVIERLTKIGSIPMLNDDVKAFRDITVNMTKTFIAKNHDYGNSFEQSLDEEGMAASRIRMGDKWNRYKTLSRAKDIKVKDESLRDTLLDLANYSIMTVMWMDKNKNK